MAEARVDAEFDPMRGPAAIASGHEGQITIGGLRAGHLTQWRVVISPMTQQPTLIGQGMFSRYYRQAIGSGAAAIVTPAAAPAYIGRKKPPTPRPFTLRGRVHELSGTAIVISYGTIVRG